MTAYYVETKYAGPGGLKKYRNVFTVRGVSQASVRSVNAVAQAAAARGRQQANRRLKWRLRPGSKGNPAGCRAKTSPCLC